MSKVPEELRYTKSHEWIRTDDDGTVVIGLTDHAQEALGDLVYVELPETGTRVDQGEACAVVESVKAASDVYSPVKGEVTESNEALDDNPELLNQDPYGDGWLMRIATDGADESGEFMDAAAYETLLAEEQS